MTEPNLSGVTNQAILENSVLRSKLANVHEKLQAIDYELEAINPIYKEAPLQFARALVKEALDITQVKKKQCKKQG